MRQRLTAGGHWKLVKKIDFARIFVRAVVERHSGVGIDNRHGMTGIRLAGRLKPGLPKRRAGADEVVRLGLADPPDLIRPALPRRPIAQAHCGGAHHFPPPDCEFSGQRTTIATLRFKRHLHIVRQNAKVPGQFLNSGITYLPNNSIDFITCLCLRPPTCMMHSTRSAPAFS